ncbi:MAG TPA: DNA-binding transcriptional regulator [Gammaproteobacteria bacterium]|nr:DNA-binding transcriptional regulator [Gammaproteobacteria bacterium]
MSIHKKERHPSLSEVIRETAKGLYDANIIDAKTMREFDEEWVPPIIVFSPTEIKKIRLVAKVSQPVFAKYFNISTSTVRQWEQGEKRPSGTSLRLLNLVAENGLGILSSSGSRNPNDHSKEGVTA